MRMTATERMRKKFESVVPGSGAFAAKGTATSIEPTEEDREFWSWVSTTDVDQEGDVVDPSGADFSYFPGLKVAGLSDEDGGVATVYMNHNYDDVDDIVGLCRRLQIKKRGGKYGMRALTRIAPGEVGDQVLRLIKGGFIRGMSVGFRTQEASAPSEHEKALYGEGAKRIVRALKMVEYSVTAMPMNQGALIDRSSIKSMASREIIDKLEFDSTPRRTIVELAPRPIRLPRTVDV
ncbi:MAG: HK97 family phage prohead protease [Phycisphaerales bacterium]|nr:HK97 family phage prohead protease [Phycisphaerales bacterium]